MKKGFACLILCALPFFIVQAAVYPAPTGFVNDFAHILTPATVQTLETKLGTYAKESGNEIAVATVSSLNGDTIENTAVKIFEEWKIGGKGTDSGVLFIIAPTERELRIEVGYGLEGTLTDLTSHRIIDEIVTPEFKNGDYDTGVSKGVDAIITTLVGQNVTFPTTQKSSQKSTRDMWIFGAFILISILGQTQSWWLGGVIGCIGGIVMGFYLGSLTYGILAVIILTPLGLLLDFLVSKAGIGRGGGGISGTSFGGGSSSGGSNFGGFGGGSSGGGGASGRW